MSDLKYRFDEIITTIRLLPDNPEEAENVIFPNYTRDLHEPELYTAILCQTFKEHAGDTEEKHEFVVKMIATLTNSAMESVMAKVERDETPDEDDMYALAVAINIAWAIGTAEVAFKLMGMIANISHQFDIEIPELAMLVLKSNHGAQSFGKLDPYRVLAGGYTPEAMLQETLGRVPDELKDILDVLRGERGNKE